MADPLLNEGAIIQMLDVISAPANVEKLASASFLSIIDSHDRKLEREDWVAIVQDALGMNDMLTRLELTNALYNRFKRNKLEDETFTDALKELTKRAEAFREDLKRRMELVAQCPYETDTRH